jgi:predicted metal-binding membrane protein
VSDWCAVPWTPLPGQTWPGTAASFLAMWTVMMVAMMLPCLVPMLRRYRERLGGTEVIRPGWPTAVAGTGYFAVWTVAGMAVFPLGAAVAELEMRLPALAHAVPLAAGVVVLVAGALQLTRWKTHHLACCRLAPDAGRVLPADTLAAWRLGLRLGLRCASGTANLMAILLVMGMMDLRVMAAVTGAMTAESLAPAGERVARAIGLIAMGVGLVVIARGTGVG